MSLAVSASTGIWRIADALIDPVLEGNLVVHAVGVKAPYLDHHHHKVRVLDGFLPVGGRPDTAG
jgi:hypothetical protein